MCIHAVCVCVCVRERERARERERERERGRERETRGESMFVVVLVRRLKQWRDSSCALRLASSLPHPPPPPLALTLNPPAFHQICSINMPPFHPRLTRWLTQSGSVLSLLLSLLSLPLCQQVSQAEDSYLLTSGNFIVSFYSCVMVRLLIPDLVLIGIRNVKPAMEIPHRGEWSSHPAHPKLEC